MKNRNCPSIKRALLKPVLLLGFSCLSVNAFSAPILDQTGNLLANGGLNIGSFDPISGTAISSAANNWSQWTNSGISLTTELITDAEMFGITGVGTKEGDAALRITTGGAGDGGFTFNTYSHPGWDTTGDVTFGAWVYVLSGQMGVFVGSNSTGFDSSLTTSTGGWEFVSVSKSGGGGIINDEPLLYSFGGAADFIVDSLWLNQGLESAHPDTASVPEPSTPFMLGLGILFLVRSLRTRIEYS
ncbi:MAG: hypothetical protein COA96_16425 [SAR86 cluster bacterium]|uniref:Ice-binding protein C-terminal domain-containing protein n=1 Tax=SAR86 cluster bacterium TaxID=2030880 RepID=A0A2A5AIH5_9GAMM|nr:MAG: hypothetical protein COA96_16425 [SAR86 cluster bacterium]